MARIHSSWLVGGVWIADQQINVDGAGNQTVLPEGMWYLRNASASAGNHSILDEMISFLVNEAGLSDVECYVTEHRRVVIAADATFTLTWSGTTLRSLLGFTGNLSGASSYTSQAIPRLLFSAGYPVLRAVDDGLQGYPEDDMQIAVSADGSIVDQDYHNSLTYDELRWTDVMRSRVRSNGAAVTQWGTFHDFRELVLHGGGRFLLYEDIIEDSSSSAEVTDWGTELGPYSLRTAVDGRYDRVARTAGSRWDLPELRAIKRSGYAT